MQLNSKKNPQILKGSFSTHTLDSVYKAKLENFIKRNKPSPNKSPPKNQSCSKLHNDTSHSPVRSSHNKKESLFQAPQSKSPDIAKGNSKSLSKFLPGTVNKIQVTSLVSSDATLSNLHQAVIQKSFSLQDKEKSLKSYLKTLKSSFSQQRSKVVQDFCREIVLGIIPVALLESSAKTFILIETRSQALSAASSKLKIIKLSLQKIKDSMEKQALNLMLKRSSLEFKSNSIEQKNKDIGKVSEKIDSNYNKDVFIQNESFLKRESLLAQRLLRISELEKEVQNKGLSNKRSSSLDKSEKVDWDTVREKENELKTREIKIGLKKKELERKRAEVNEIEVKVKQRLSNLAMIEKKSEKMGQVKAKIQAFEELKKKEEKELQDLDMKIQEKECKIKELQNQCSVLEEKCKTIRVCESSGNANIEKDAAGRIEPSVYREKSFKVREESRVSNNAQVLQKRNLSEKLISAFNLQK